MKSKKRKGGGMIFFVRSQSDDSERKISPKNMEVYDEIRNMRESDKAPIHKFTEKTILYTQKIEAESEKKVRIESGIKPAAKEVFGKRDEIHKKIDDLLNLTFEYENKVIDCYKDNDLERLLKIYDNYKKEFSENFELIDNISREKGKDIFRKRNIERVLNAIKQIKIDFLEYKNEVECDLRDIKKISNDLSYIA